jgi:xylan 1,4-beta-xylosidase
VNYANPILPGFHPDPSVCRVGSDYYLATSSFEYFPGVPLFHSRDLVHFRPIGHALTRASQLPLASAKSSEGIFAPTLRYHRGTFYLVTTNVSGGGNFYVTAQDPSGPWSEPVWLPEADSWADPSLLFDDDGRVYFTRHGGGERGGIYQTELDLERGELRGEARLIWSGTGGIWPEGPHLYRHAGLYYLMIAEGGTGYDHAVTVARSSSPHGPFEPCPRNPILTHCHRKEHAIQATGHADWVRTESGADFLVFLGIRPARGRRHHLGRETFLAPMTWDDTGFPVVNAGRGVELVMSAPGLPESAPFAAREVRDDFTTAELGLEWNFVRNPDPDCWSLRARPGFLRLMGSSASLDVVGRPAFVARRQQHFECSVRTLLEFEPVTEGQEAGLSVRANEANHYELSVVRSGGKRRVRLRTRVLGETRVTGEVEAPEGPLVLAIDATREHYVFSMGSENQPARTLGEASTEPLSTELAGGFTGVYFGMYAFRSSAAPAPPADFDWFEYRAVE